jgi:predicted heme/steroid binding protein
MRGEILKKELIILLVLLSVFLAIGCAGNKPVTSNGTGVPNASVTPVTVVTAAKVVTPTGKEAIERLTANETQNETEKTNLKEFTLEELAEYKGKNGTSYVVYEGKVYDVSMSELWKDGDHKGHKAGKDLTEELNNSKHGPQVIKGFPVVGTLKK